MNRIGIRTAAWAICVMCISFAVASADEKSAVAPPPTTSAPPATMPVAPLPGTMPTTRPDPKPLSENVKKGMAYLAGTQLASGAWAQGDESAAMGNSLDHIKASPNVADTCMAVMALVRGGSTPKGGEFQDQVLKALQFVCGQVEASSDSDLYVTDLRQTRTQMKLGAYIDTFMAARALAEVRNEMPDKISAKRVDAALAKVVKKIESNQQQDGRWAGGGWAPVLAQGQATVALNAAMQNGAAVNEKTRAAAEQVAQVDFSKMGTAAAGVSTGSPGAVIISGSATFAGGSVGGGGAGGAVGGGGGGAGVELYGRAAQLAGMQSSANTNDSLRAHFGEVANSPTTAPADRTAAKAMLKRFDDNDKDLALAQDAVVNRLQDKQFVAGFGSNGGEEFLSYLDIGESLILKGGNAWVTWDNSITENLNRIQNADGSWSGQHCITGRTFCSAAALMVLTIDRAPLPAAPGSIKTVIR